MDSGTLIIRSSDGDRVQGAFFGSIGNGASKINATEGSFNAKLHLYLTSDTSSYSSDTLLNVIRAKHRKLLNKKIIR